MRKSWKCFGFCSKQRLLVLDRETQLAYIHNLYFHTQHSSRTKEFFNLEFQEEKSGSSSQIQINPKMIWHSEIQDWILFKVQVQQDFSTFWDEMNYTMTFKLILNINNEIMTNFNLDIGIFQIIIFYFIFLSLQK